MNFSSATIDVDVGSTPLGQERNEQSYPSYPLSHTQPMMASASHKVYAIEGDVKVLQISKK